MTKNEYEKQIEYLTENPDRIGDAWVCGEGLFAFCSKSRSGVSSGIGCLTMIRKDHHVTSEAFEDEIRTDQRIPVDPLDVRPEHLPVFKEWQEKLDVELEREPYVFTPFE